MAAGRSVSLAVLGLMSIQVMYGGHLSVDRYRLESASRAFNERPEEQYAGIDGKAQTAPQGSNLMRSNLNLMGEAPMTLPHDGTIRLSPRVDRPWLQLHGDYLPEFERAKIPRPTRRLVLTDMGWNHRYLNGLTYPRSLRSRELLQAFVDHPHFDPTFRWTDEMESGRNATFFDGDDAGVHYVVLMDIETCFESNYPWSSTRFEDNADKQGGRSTTSKASNPCYRLVEGGGCHEKHVKRVLESPLFLSRPDDVSLMYWECGGGGIHMPYRTYNPNPNLYLFSYSSTEVQLSTVESDMGGPMPAAKLVTLSHRQRMAIEECDESDRPFLYTFRGAMRGQARKDLLNVHNGFDVIVPFFIKGIDMETNETYSNLLFRAIFSGAPRGDNLFSYRFVEVLSAGAIPVVHADDWALPFHPRLVDWGRCVVRIEESKANDTVNVLRRIGKEERCKMRRFCYSVYRRYMVNPEANIAGMIESIEVARSLRA